MASDLLQSEREVLQGRLELDNDGHICFLVPPHILRALSISTEDRSPASEVLRCHETSSDVQELLECVGEPARSRRRLFRAIYDSAAVPPRLVRWEGRDATGDASADDCYEGFGSVFRFFCQVLGRESIGGAGKKLVGWVHDRCRRGVRWDGSKAVFGDGDGETFVVGGFTKALEMVGHALVHGIIDGTAGLSYRGETGALAESIADVFGSVVKQYVLRQTASDADWLFGAGVLEPAIRGVALRSLKEPGTAYDDRRLGGRDPQVAHVSKYVDTLEDAGGTYVNSGIPNNAFYRVAIAFGGHSWEKAGKIWYAALTDARMTPYATFKQFADLTCDAALRMFGDAARSVVGCAWTAVGVLSPSSTYVTVYQPGRLGDGIGGYDLKSEADRAFSFDYDHSGKCDHLVLYRPGTGVVWILKNDEGSFSTVYVQSSPSTGIGGYDLKSPADRAFAFDYDHSGKLDHLVLYRPGTGVIWILKNDKGIFSVVYGWENHGKGIGGYDLKSAVDRAFAFDYDHSGKLDHLALYRPGSGVLWILKNDKGAFSVVHGMEDHERGIAGYDLRSPADRAFAFDYDHSKKQDHVVLYRPGTGTVWILKNTGGRFFPVYRQGHPGGGIGDYDLASPDDRVFQYDYDGVGKFDHLVLYRPGTGVIWILKNGKGIFSVVYGLENHGKGIGGYDLKSNADRVFGFDFHSNGTTQDLVLYRPASGTIRVLKRKCAF